MRSIFKNTGFTLIELLVVIAIIGLLSSVVLVTVNSARMKSRDLVRIATLKQVETALELYYDKYGHYPIAELEVDIGECGRNHFDVANDFADLDACGNYTADYDTSLSEPWIPQLGPPGYEPETCPTCEACPSVGEGFLSSWWIKDPVNSYPVRYVYAVTTDLSTYEITVPLETNSNLMTNDGGNANNRYEVGPGRNILCRN